MSRNNLIKVLALIVIAALFSACSMDGAAISGTSLSNTVPYDPNKIKSGDIISGMQVKDFKLNEADKFDDNDDLIYSIQFSGEFELSGKLATSDETDHYYFFNEEFVSDKLPFSSFEAEIESDKQEKMNVWFAITNDDELVNKLKEEIKDFKYGDEVKVRAIFSDYYLWLYELDYGYAARLNKIVSITK